VWPTGNSRGDVALVSSSAISDVAAIHKVSLTQRAEGHDAE
jgi:hypothetical protein